MSKAFFTQTQVGHSDWWRWIIAFWLTIFIWVVLSGIIMTPLGFILQGLNPDLVREFYIANAQMIPTDNAARFQTVTLGLGVSALLVLIFWFLNRVTRGIIQQGLGGLTALSLVTNVYLFTQYMSLINNGPADTVFLKIVGASPVAYLLMLLTFPALLVGLYICQKWIHHRPLRSLHTAARRFRWGRCFQIFGFTVLIMSTLSLVMHITGLSPIGFTFDANRFWIYAAISLLFIPLQAATEEIMIRGYMNQGLAHFIPNIWVVFILTSLLFAALHLANPEAIKSAQDGTFLLIMAGYFGFGLIACLLTWFDNGLEGAIGLHVANNLFAAIAVNYEGSVLPTPSLFISTPNPSLDIPLMLISGGLIVYYAHRTARPLTVENA